MEYFLDTVETIPPGVGFSLFGKIHWMWLTVFILFTVGSCLWYHGAGAEARANWEKGMALFLLGDELFKMACLTIGQRYLPDYLPLHLCSINIFLILFHSRKKNETLNHFLYTVGIPGAMAALLFPSWAELPLGNFMHIHSFTVHILLAAYPIVLAVNGVLRPSAGGILKCLALLLAMAAPICLINLWLGTNFMFLMWAEPGNPLYLFQQLWGSHLYGFPVIIAGVLLLMYLPLELIRKYRKPKPAKK